MQPYVDGLRRRGVAAFAIDLPKRPVKAEQAVPAFLAAIPKDGRVAIGGHSYGGRVASLLAAQHRFDRLLLFSYPLHLPGRPDWEVRSHHWPAIACPVLLLSGEADPFARIELLRRAVRRLPDGRLITFPGEGHGLRRALEDALDRAAAFLLGRPQ